MIKKINNNNLIIFWLIIVCSLPLITHALVGKNFHYIGDDYGVAYQLNEHGFFGSLIWWYQSWSGEISGLIIKNLFSIITPSDYFGPWVLILVLTITQIFGLSKLFNYSGTKTSLLYTLLISLILISVSLDLLPILNRTEYPYYFPPGGCPSFVISSVYQTLYWQINAEQIFFSLSIMWILIGLITHSFVHKKLDLNNYKNILLILFITFFIAGVRSTFTSIMLFITASTIVYMIYLNFHKKYKNLYLLVWLMIGVTALALLIMVKAPGTNIRRSFFQSTSDPVEFLKIIYNAEKYFFYKMLKWPGNIISIIQLVLISIFVGYKNKKHTLINKNRALSQIKVISFILLIYILCIPFVSFGPSIIATSRGLHSRVQIFPIYFLVLGLGTWGFCLGRYLFEKISNWLTEYYRFTNALIAIIILIISLNNFRDAHKIYQAGHRVDDYYDLLEKRDLLIKNAIADGKKKIAVPEKINFLGVGGLASDSSHWVNEMWSSYYGITIISE